MDKFDKLLFYFVIEFDNVEIFNLLINRGVDINLSIMYGIIFFMFVCIILKLFNRKEMVSIFLEKGVLVDLMDVLDYKIVF